MFATFSEQQFNQNDLARKVLEKDLRELRDSLEIYFDIASAI